MKFVYGRQNMTTLERAQEQGFLLANGLGGFASMTAAFSATRCDHSILMAAAHAPNDRVALVHRLSETLRTQGGEEAFLSSQGFASRRAAEDGYRHMTSFVYDGTPVWRYHVFGAEVTRSMAMAYGENTTALLYQIDNRSGEALTLTVTPQFQFAPKGFAPAEMPKMKREGSCVSANGYRVFLRTDGEMKPVRAAKQTLSYPDDAQDGRAPRGTAGSCLQVAFSVPAGQARTFELVFSDRENPRGAEEILAAHRERLCALLDMCPLKDETARALALAADAYIVRRDSTGEKSIIAGYPFFGDWGRDTMIALPGCALATGRYDVARSILRTFLAYEKDGLVPNLFPEGENAPMYNTVDAALLMINIIYLYHRRTGDDAFVREAWPVMARIAAAYQAGTRHGIAMDEDGLIRAGQGMDQVTWMDVCVEGILPTPRHGKPVEINAYWYSALKVLEAFAPLCGADGAPYGMLAQRVRASFERAFFMPQEGYLRDVISGTDADTQLRCNQIWAVTMPFTMLSEQQERSVVNAVRRHLYTPCGLRTLSPTDAQFHPTYGGAQKERDMAYHQGTAWVFPMGAYMLAELKTGGRDAAARVRGMLEAMEPMLREGCAGQLPEIYDGACPGFSRGCFAQAWSVGEMLRVYEALEAL